MVKALFILVLAAAVFGTGAYFTYELYVKPDRALRAEKERGPPPPPPDPSLPEFAACAELKKKGDAEGARTALIAFLEHNPHSPKTDEAREMLGEINANLFLSKTLTPEKQIYIVAKGDVINRVAMRTHSTPELIMRTNNLTGNILRIGQKLIIPPADFSAVISMRNKTLTLYNAKHFFKQYPILAMPARDAGAHSGPPAPKRVGKVVSKLATDKAGTHFAVQDKGYADAFHEVSLSIPGHSLYAIIPADENAKPVERNGIGFAPKDIEEIAVLLKKNDTVTIE